MVESGGDDQKPVFYIYEESMLLHADHTYHGEDGKMKDSLPDDVLDSYPSPEVPFRIKSIYEYLSTS